MLRGLQALITVIEIVGSFIWVRLLYSQKESSLLKKIMYVAGVILIIALTIFQRNGAMYSRYYLLICIGLSSLVYFLQFIILLGGNSMLMQEVKHFWVEEDGIGVIEVVLILVVLISLVIIFKGQITALLNDIFGQINSQSREVY